MLILLSDLLQCFGVFWPFRNAVMFNNEHMADVHFIVGPPGATHKVPAHKVSLKSFKENHPLMKPSVVLSG